MIRGSINLAQRTEGSQPNVDRRRCNKFNSVIGYCSAIVIQSPKSHCVCLAISSAFR